MVTADCPRRLYKYCSPERLDALETGTLRYSPLGAFNDPFEGRPEVTALTPDAEALQTFERLVPEEARAMHEALPAEVKAALPFSQLLPLLQQYARTKQAEMLHALKSIAAPAVAFIQRKFDEQIGALCLSEQPGSLQMWSHYAASHSGFLLEFDAQHEHFWEQRSPDDELRHLRRVVYRDTRPSATLTDFDGVEWFFVKSSHWSYEREWRVLRALVDAARNVPTHPFPVCLFSFPRGAVTSVVLGSRVSAETESGVRTVLASHSDYRVTIQRAVPDSTHFHLKILGAGT